MLTFAWACGVFEGEGSCCVTKAGGRRLAIGMTDADVLQRVQDAFGVGRIRGPYKGTNKPIWHWEVTNWPQAVALLDKMWPFLSERRREQATRFIEARPRTINGPRNASHCVHGHPFTEANTYVFNGARSCRVCRAEAAARKRRELGVPTREPAPPKPCRICGRFDSRKYLRKGRCNRCAQYFHRTGREHPVSTLPAA
jgi:hypothetical protein